MASRYKIEFTHSFLRDLKPLSKEMQKRIIQHLEGEFLQNPFYRTVKLEGLEIGKYRTRIGDYRARFDVEKDLIILRRIRHRKDIYKQ